MIVAVLADALRTLDSDDTVAAAAPLTNPRGGFTDVGLHTGGVARDTAWPTLQAVAQALLHPRLFRTAMVQLRLWLWPCLWLWHRTRSARPPGSITPRACMPRARA